MGLKNSLKIPVLVNGLNLINFPEIPKCSSLLGKGDPEDITNWKQKAQKRLGQTSITTLKAMKKKWQRLANFNKLGSSFNDSKV